MDEIVGKRPDLTRDHVFGLIDDKKREGRGLLSDEGAARLVAEELLIQTRGAQPGRMQVKDLVSGLNDVSVSGLVIQAWPPQQFQRRDGSAGRVMRLMLVDRSGRIRCVFWDRHAEVLSRAGKLPGRILRIGHAYTRQGLAGDTEVHGGDRASVDIDPQDLPTADFPEFQELFTPLGKLAPDSYQLNVVGVVQSEPRLHTFQKEDRAGKVLRTSLADESGTIPLVAWNERAEDLKEVKKGDIVQVLNARTRLNTNTLLELHVEGRSQAEILTSPPEYLLPPVAKAYKIAELRSSVGPVDLLVSILVKGPVQEIKRPTGEATKVARLIVSDDTGIVSLSLWDNKAELVSGYAEGESVELRGVSVRERLGEMSLNLGNDGELRKSTQSVGTRPITKLDGLQAAKGLLIVEGSVSDQPLARQVVTEKGETVSLASFTLRDDAGLAKVTFWRDQVDLITKMRPRTRVRVVGLRVRAGLGGDPELNSIPATKVEVIDDPTSERPAWEDIRHVISLEPGLTTWVKGVVIGIVGDAKIMALCESCKSQLKADNNVFVCANCQSNRSANIRLNARFKIDDGTGVAEILVSGFDPALFISTNPTEVTERMLKEGKTELPIEHDDLAGAVGKEFEILGTAQPTGTQTKFEVRATKVLVVKKL